MSRYIDGIRLMLLVAALLLRVNGFVQIYMKRKEVWKTPAVILNMFSPVLALLTISIVTSKNHKELSRSSSSWNGFLLIGAFLLSQLFAGATYAGAIFILGLDIPTGRVLGPGASASGFTPLHLLGLISLYSLILLCILRIMRPEIGARELFKGKKILITTKILYLSLIPITILIWGFSYLVDESGLTPSTNPLLGFDGTLEAVSIFIAIVIIAPLLEEIFFRGHLFKFFQDKFGGNTAILVTALLFAAAHFSLINLIPIFVMGLLMGWARKRTGSILPSLAFHMINNLVAFSLLLLSG